MTEKRVSKLDPNTEAFQMRAQWKKAEICRKQWHERWDWLLDEYKPVESKLHSIAHRRKVGCLSVFYRLYFEPGEPVPASFNTWTNLCGSVLMSTESPRACPTPSPDGKASQKSSKIRAKHADALPKPKPTLVSTRSLKPVPQTTTGFIGWLGSKPECKLEIYTSWLQKRPLKSPDTWDNRDYLGPDKS